MHIRFACFAGALALLPVSALACSSCGCTLSSDWDSQGYAVASGFRLDLRYDFLDQSQLRSGTGSVRRADFSPPQDREIEQGTLNRYTTLGVDYSPDAAWGVNLQLPWIDRSHQTIAAGDTAVSSSFSRGIGDARVIARYQGFTPQHDVGIQFGLKLPTGRHDDVFASGPQAGEALDRGLQPGSGTTDLLLGAYKFGAINQDFDWFAQGMLQIALNSRDDYRTGASLNANAGLRYMVNPGFTPQLQINARVVRRDSGAQADVENSGGSLIDLSPGITARINDRLHAYGFMQVPVYQRVNGFQLAPRWTTSIGLRYAF